MKFSTGVTVAALAGLALSASREPADVYILTQHPHSSPTPQIPRQVARHIFSQRLGTDAIVSDLPGTIDSETALSYISEYGTSPAPLFQQSADISAAPSQLVVILEGSTAEKGKALTDLLSKEGYRQPTFKVSDPPSAKANKHFINTELRIAGVSDRCTVAAAMDPFDDSCWTGRSLAVTYDMAKDADAYSALRDQLPSLLSLVSKGDLEATLVFMPESSRSSKLDYWSTSAPQLRRRAFDDSPITEEPLDLPAKPNKQIATGDDGAPLPWAGASTKAAIPSCFQSQNSCVTATGSCSGHGVCEDRYAIPGKGSASKVCFRCRCESTFKYPEQGEDSPRIHWGGQICQKRDVSSPFWLLTGLSIVLVGAVSFCIGLLFSVGEEKLPGVIGAGVSRSK
ncbi:Arsenate reductase [Pleurostoma richardsiae]|uniref:Arsenate reductase n=1 Tax=Pleurostoma richardsiae TaxID=41990 RepID=A0AA38R476_9PEZI|nr:Arsenate reductase [Pleurostoma richardsiae]